MKSQMAAVIVTLALAASTARGQDVIYPTVSYSATPVVSSYYSAPVTSWWIGPAYYPSYGYYSYYIMAPYPSRGYVGYGASDQFPFYGQPYGRAYDPWTWDYMGGGMAYRAHYFYPPVR